MLLLIGYYSTLSPENHFKISRILAANDMLHILYVLSLAQFPEVDRLLNAKQHTLFHLRSCIQSIKSFQMYKVTLRAVKSKLSLNLSFCTKWSG